MPDDTTEHATVFIAPDIRTQTVQDAVRFIEEKRQRRLILFYTAQEKLQQKLSRIGATENDKFIKQRERLDKALDNITVAIQKAEEQLRKLQEIDHKIANVEKDMQL
jgi:hypothetical protein